MIGLAIGLFALAVSAYAVVAACDREASPGATTFFLRFSLAIGLGLGLASCAYFLGLFLNAEGGHYRTLELPILLVTGLLGGCWLCRAWLHTTGPCGFKRPSTRFQSAPSAPVDLHRWLVLSFVATLLLAISGAIATFYQSPFGDWDAWALWNLRAKGLFLASLAGSDWRQAFSPVFSHTDYPLLLPCGVARAWSYLDADNCWAPWFLGCLFTLATVGVLAAGLSRLRSPSQGLLAGMVLLGVVSFVQRGALQYADVPLSFFMLAAVVLLATHDASPRSQFALVALSGLMAALAAWTKNEGLLFLVALPAARGLVVGAWAGVKQWFKEFTYWCAGAGPVLAVIVIQKAFLSGSNDLVDGQGWEATFARLVDPCRYWYISQALVLGVLRTARPFAVILPLGFFLLGVAKTHDGLRRGRATAVAVLVLMLSGYFLVYLTTPQDLHWHLATSAGRLILQVWPLALFILFLTLATPEEARDAVRKGAV